MATFSLGSGTTPGAPGVYINEQAGRAAAAAVTDFSTVYMLVETDEAVPVAAFPFNSPVAITSLNDYKELIRVGTSTVPEGRIPLLSYNCVNEFYQNSQVGDLRVVRVGTPNEIVELEFFPTGTKISTTGLPSALAAGDVVYIQVIINGQKLVAGDGATGYTSSGEWLGVPVTVPVTYVSGDEANNRRISKAIADAVSSAIESNPSINTSVYVRETGLVNDRNPASNSETSFVSIAAATYNGALSVTTETVPVGANFALMQNGYDINNIVGGNVQLVRVPQDYTQCISTAFDGQQDQGYLITPTAYAQFDAAGRALVGAAAAAHCASNNYKWMALADPGPFLVTDINQYSAYAPHKAAADLVEGSQYLIDNAIYKWTGNTVNYDELRHQSIVFGESAETAIRQSANLVTANTKFGLLDSGKYTIAAVPSAVNGEFNLGNNNYWPVDLPIQKVNLTGADTGNDFTNVSIQGGLTGVNLNGTEVYVIAAPANLDLDAAYSFNRVFLATTPSDASSVYSAIVLAGGSDKVTAPPTGAVFIPAPTGDTAQIAYNDAFWDLPQTINGQTSDLLQNTSGADAGVNTLHLPGTLQDPTTQYNLNWVSRLIVDPAASIASSSGVTKVADGSALLTVNDHGLRDGQKVFFTQAIKVTVGTATSDLFSATTKLVTVAYWVKVVTKDTFVLSDSLANFTIASYIAVPTGATFASFPTIVYTQVLGRGVTDINPIELVSLPFIRGRKYAFDSNSIWSQALESTVTPAGSTVTGNPYVSLYFNNSSVILGEDQITPYGEDLTSLTKSDWLPKLNLVAPTLTPVPAVNNVFCSPTTEQFFPTESYLVPSIDAINIGSYDPAGTGTIGPAATLTVVAGATPPTLPDGVYDRVAIGGGSGSGLTATVTIAGNAVTTATVENGGQGYLAAEAGLTLPTDYGDATLTVATVVDAGGSISNIFGAYGTALAPARILVGSTDAQLMLSMSKLVGTYLDVAANGTAPDGTTAVVIGDRLTVKAEGLGYVWVAVKADADGGDLTAFGSPCYGSQLEMVYTPEQGVPTSLQRFDAITATEIIDNALRGVGFNGQPQAVLVEAGVDTVNRLLDDSQRYFDPFGFIAFYGPYIENGAGQFIPPSSYVSGVAVRRYRAEGYQFPPAGVKYQLADAVNAQINVNSAQQNLLNPKGCNVVRTLPGYPQTAVFIWGGRTRVNQEDAQQRLYQFVNTRVILNVVYGSLRNAFDSQIFSVIDGFGVIYNQIISIGNSVLNQLFVRGALFGAKPRDAFQVICDDRINLPENLENGVVQAKVFVTPVPTLERIQIDLIRVAVGKMQEDLDIQGLGSSNQ